MGFDMGTLVWITAGAKYRLSERVKNGVRDNQERARWMWVTECCRVKGSRRKHFLCLLLNFL